MNLIKNCIPSVFHATETFLSELNPYVPLLSGITGILITADGVSRLIRYGVSKRTLMQTAAGIGMIALSYYGLNKISERQAQDATAVWSKKAVAKATRATQSVLEQSLFGLNSTRDAHVSCELNANSKDFLPVIYRLGWRKLNIHTMYNDCVVTLSKAVDNTFWLEKLNTNGAKICVPITEGIIYRAHHFGATPPVSSGIIADFQFKAL